MVQFLLPEIYPEQYQHTIDLNVFWVSPADVVGNCTVVVQNCRVIVAEPAPDLWIREAGLAADDELYDLPNPDFEPVSVVAPLGSRGWSGHQLA